jgi:hypothetical protein
MRTTTKPTATINIELPPQGGSVMPSDSLADEAHALRVMLDRSENMKVAVGQKLLELLNNRFAGNRNALRDWYETEVFEGKAHRAWSTVQQYLGVVRTYGERAAEEFERAADLSRANSQRWYADIKKRADAYLQENIQTNKLGGSGSTHASALREEKSEYEQRKQWLATMDYYWFKGKPEWQNKWLGNRGLRKER